MLPQDYINKASVDSDSQCFLGLIPSSVDFFVFGDTFMRGFYMIHDDPQGLVGIVPHANSYKSSPILATQATMPAKPLDASKFFGLTL